VLGGGGFWNIVAFMKEDGNGHSELTATYALVGHFVHEMGYIFSFGAKWGSS
jgi:hypothetical protein